MRYCLLYKELCCMFTQQGNSLGNWEEDYRPNGAKACQRTALECECFAQGLASGIYAGPRR